MSAVLNENEIVERVLDGARISQDDARALYMAANGLVALGERAGRFQASDGKG